MSRTLAAVLLLLLPGCVVSTNLPGPDEYRSAGTSAPPGLPPGAGTQGGPGEAAAPASLRAPGRDGILVQAASFNIRYGREVEGALALIRSTPELAGVDFLLLQEMDARGTERLARALGMAWVYYPAILRDGRQFGNAILSRWPLSDDRKVVLPHHSWFGRAQRIAVAATADVGGTPVRVYSVHLATPVNLGLSRREAQLRAVLDAAASYERVILGGDLNSDSLARIAEDRGYFWPTREGPPTVWFGRADHLVYRGLVPTWGSFSGTVEGLGAVSDHRPVWARGWLR